MKYKPEFRKQAIQLSYKIGIQDAANQLNISPTSLRNWRRHYENGDKSLNSFKNPPMTAEQKYQIAKEYIDGDESFRTIANRYGITNPGIIGKWVNAVLTEKALKTSAKKNLT